MTAANLLAYLLFMVLSGVSEDTRRWVAASLVPTAYLMWERSSFGYLLLCPAVFLLLGRKRSECHARTRGCAADLAESYLGSAFTSEFKGVWMSNALPCVTFLGVCFGPPLVYAPGPRGGGAEGQEMFSQREWRRRA